MKIFRETFKIFREKELEEGRSGKIPGGRGAWTRRIPRRRRTMTRGGGSVGGGGGRGGRVSEAELYVVMVDDESKVT